MNIPLSSFEHHIEEVILKRGLAYFKKGHIEAFEELSPGEFECVVVGTEAYTVRLRLEQGNVVDYVCSCPYDLGAVCKHIAASIFYLLQGELGLTVDSTSNNRRIGQSKSTDKESKKSSKKTTAEKIGTVLDKFSHDDLKQYVLEILLKRRDLREVFLAKFGFEVDAESKARYAKQIKAILRSAMGRSRFIDWRHIGEVGTKLNEMILVAHQHLENRNYQSVVFLCTALLEELTKALEFSDDSSGDIGFAIESAYTLLSQVADCELQAGAREKLFEYCLETYQKGIFSGWDWHNGILFIAAQLISSEKEGKRILGLLNLKNSHESDFQDSEARKIELRIIQKIDGAEAAIRYMEAHVKIPDFRRELIKISLADKDFERAVELANDGISTDSKRYPGLVSEWRENLLDIAILQEDRSQIVKRARLLFTENFRHTRNYYDIMKANLPESDWKGFVEELILDLVKSPNRTGILVGIYIQEQWWDRLLGLLEKNPSLPLIEDLEKYLRTDYADELIRLYEKCIYEFIERAMNRTQYQEGCRYFRRMIKLGGRETVKKMLEEIRIRFPKRKALMEELTKV